MGQSDEGCRFYEQDLLPKATGGALSPAGSDLTERALLHLGLPPAGRVLDVGCGTGATVRDLIERHGLRAIGVDASELLLQNGRSIRPGLPLVRGRGARLPFGAATLDALLAECSLSAMGSLAGTLAEFQRILTPGGCLVSADIYIRRPEGQAALRNLPFQCGLQAALTEAQIQEALHQAGFEIVFWEDHSQAIRRLTGQLILTYGSMEGFWQRAYPEEAHRPDSRQISPLEIQWILAGARLGYYLLAARKAG